jgi:excisionase family DNA binding protein
VSERLLTAAEVAELLAVPVSWVRESTRSGAMPCVGLGRYKRYRREAVERSKLTRRSHPHPGGDHLVSTTSPPSQPTATAV